MFLSLVSFILVIYFGTSLYLNNLIFFFFYASKGNFQQLPWHSPITFTTSSISPETIMYYSCHGDWLKVPTNKNCSSTSYLPSPFLVSSFPLLYVFPTCSFPRYTDSLTLSSPIYIFIKHKIHEFFHWRLYVSGVTEREPALDQPLRRGSFSPLLSQKSVRAVTWDQHNMRPRPTLHGAM